MWDDDDMLGASRSTRNLSPQFLPAIDRLLTTGLRLGPAGKREAINKVLELLPQWKRGDCWRRIRQLRRAGCRAAHALDPLSGKRQSAALPPRHPSSARRWTARDDRQLFNWAGYEPVERIAERLGRSKRAIRFRLGALGMSAKVRDGWSQRSLMKLLRVSPARLRSWLASGALRVRDSRITRRSLQAFHQGQDPSSRLLLAASGEDRYTWDAAAHLLGVTAAEIQTLVRLGRLNMSDTFVSERSFEEFCRKRGSEINMGLLDRATAEWLTSEYGVPPGARSVPRAQKHVLTVRSCPCGRKIAGNVFFRHRKHCAIATRKPRMAELARPQMALISELASQEIADERLRAAARLP